MARDIVQSRLRNWQRREFLRLKEKYGISMSDISRLSLNYFLVNYKGKINSDLIDAVEFNAWKKVGRGLPILPK